MLYILFYVVFAMFHVKHFAVYSCIILLRFIMFLFSFVNGNNLLLALLFVTFAI